MTPAAPFYVYIICPMTGYPGDYLASCAEMSRYARQFIELGMCPINPAGDMLEGLASPVPLADSKYKRRSMDLLRLLEGRPAAVFVVATKHRDGIISSGVADEITESGRLGIPVTYDVGSLLAVRAGT
jgi:hypothetical protein